MEAFGSHLPRVTGRETSGCAINFRMTRNTPAPSSGWTGGSRVRVLCQAFPGGAGEGSGCEECCNPTLALGWKPGLQKVPAAPAPSPPPSPATSWSACPPPKRLQQLRLPTRSTWRQLGKQGIARPIRTSPPGASVPHVQYMEAACLEIVQACQKLSGWASKSKRTP